MNDHPPINIAIDGPTASGKGTLARQLAARLDYACLDTGLLYRAVGIAALRRGRSVADTSALALTARELQADQAGLLELLADPELRSEVAADGASRAAAVPQVRAALHDFQREFAARPPQDKGGAVLDGRDIGTVILPQAQVKLYITASAEVRATRRFKELQMRGAPADFVTVLADLRARDYRDANRTIAPTMPAVDAVIVDTDNMTADEVLGRALDVVKKKLGDNFVE